jgi:general secretion pathway protein E
MAAKNIGDILVELKAFTQQQLHDYIKASKEAGVSLDQYALTNKLVTEELLAKARGIKFNIPYIEAITDKMADAEMLGKIPLKFLRENIVIPTRDEDNDIVLIISDPLNFQALDELDLLLGGYTKRAVSTNTVIINAINKYYPLEGTKEMIEELEEDKELSEVGLDFAAIQEEDILGMASEAPIIKLVNHILYQAVKRDASDIHIEPFEKELQVRYRIDGILYHVMTPPKRAQAAISSRIKIMANLNIAEKRQPQDGRIQIKIADKPIDIRVSVIPVTFGERIVLRLLDKSKSFASLKQLGFSERDYKVIMHSIEQPNGIILVTGPTGSGKTTTLYSVLNRLNDPSVNIITVEDPVEYQIQGINQVQVREQIGLTFAAALRSILRQDPDIIMIGETRDVETAQIAIQASLTGHLVLSTIHTNSAAATITRLLDMGIEPFLIASTVLSITAQRLVRVLCPKCKEAYKPQPDLLKRLGISEAEARSTTFYRAKGCDECAKTGYKGRMALFEIMLMTPEIAHMTMERTDAAQIQRQAIKDGMTLLLDDGIRKAKLGLTTIEEVLTVAAASFDQAADV